MSLSCGNRDSGEPSEGIGFFHRRHLRQSKHISANGKIANSTKQYRGSVILRVWANAIAVVVGAKKRQHH